MDEQWRKHLGASHSSTRIECKQCGNWLDECESWRSTPSCSNWYAGTHKPATMAEAPTALPTKADERKGVPMASGLLDYFTSALAEVARVSKAGNDQHNPGQPLHWARGKSQDHADCIVRHLAERGAIDTDGMRHSAKLAWRALALLQIELEAAGAPISRGSK